MKVGLVIGIILLSITVVIHCEMLTYDSNPCEEKFLKTEDEDYGVLNFILKKEVTLPNFLYFLDKQPLCRNTTSKITLGFLLWRLSYTERRFNNLTLEDVRNINLTEYRLKFPYPFWYSLNATDSHTNRPSFVSLPFIFHCFVTAFVITMIRFLADPLFARISDYIGCLPNDTSRFQENSWQCLYYILSWTFVASYVLRSDFYYDAVLIFEGDFPNQPLPNTVYLIYLLNIGWYLHGLYGLFTGLESVKKDFNELLLHHVITISLLYFSMLCGYWKFGVLVLYTHDLCDVFLQIPRLYLLLDNAGHFGPPEQINSLFEAAIFVPLPVSWIYFRLYLYPVKVIYPAVAIVTTTVPWEGCDYYWYFCVGLFVLLMLQYFWFVLIMMIAWKKVYDGESFDDVRDRVRVSEKDRLEQEENAAIAAEDNKGEVTESGEKKENQKVGRRRVRYNIKSPSISASPNVGGGISPRGKSPGILGLGAVTQSPNVGSLTGGGKSPRG